MKDVSNWIYPETSKLYQKKLEICFHEMQGALLYHLHVVKYVQSQILAGSYLYLCSHLLSFLYLPLKRHLS